MIGLGVPQDTPNPIINTIGELKKKNPIKTERLTVVLIIFAMFFRY
jgi:hypothetical protein